MTKIVYSIEKMYLNAEGHAGADKPGNDIVCAAISALTQTLRKALSQEEDQDHIETWWSIKPGDVRIRVNQVKSWKYGLIARTYFRMAVIGLKDIAAQYPENIELEEVQDSGII